MNEYMEKTCKVLIPVIPTPILRIRFDWEMYKGSGYTDINELVKDTITLTEGFGYCHYLTSIRKIRYAAEIVFTHYCINIEPRSAMENLQRACYEGGIR